VPSQAHVLQLSISENFKIYTSGTAIVSMSAAVQDEELLFLRHGSTNFNCLNTLSIGLCQLCLLWYRPICL